MWAGYDVILPEPDRWVTHSPDSADRLYQREAFRVPPRGRRLVPFTRNWFQHIEQQTISPSRGLDAARLGIWSACRRDDSGFGRRSRHRLACNTPRHGASVIACSDSREQLGLIQLNFRLSDHEVRIAHAPPHALPFDGAID